MARLSLLLLLLLLLLLVRECVAGASVPSAATASGGLHGEGLYPLCFVLGGGGRRGRGGEGRGYEA